MDQPEFNQFATTHWTAVRACVQTNGDGIVARHELCRNYWYPVYAHLRHLGHSGHEATQLTQQFFAHVVQSPWLSRANPAAGRFRVFLLHQLESFRKDRLNPAKNPVPKDESLRLPVDLSQAETRYLQNASGARPGAVYDAEWAKSVAQSALDRLEAEYAAAGKKEVFRALKMHLTVRGEESGYVSTATALKMPAEAVQEGVRRLRNRYGALLREEIARTVGAAHDLDAEMKYLRGAIRSA